MRWLRQAVVVLVMAVLALALPAAAQEPSPKHLKVVTKSFPPFVLEDERRPQGFSIDLLDKMAARMGFTYELQFVDSVSDQIAGVESGQADLAIAGISITSAREQRVDFSYPMFHSGLQILTRSDEGSEPSIAAALSQTVWPLLAKLLLLLIVVAHAVWLLHFRRRDDYPKGYFRGVGEGLWFAAESMATVGYGDGRPRTLVGRLAAVSWMFLAIFVVANLTGSISANLVGQQIKGTIAGPDDLPGKRIATVANTTSEEYLRGRKLSVVVADSIEAAFGYLQEGRVDAVVLDSPVLRYYASKEGKGLVRVVGPVFSLQDYGIAVAKDSPLRKELNRTLLEIMEDGTYSRLEQSWFGD